MNGISRYGNRMVTKRDWVEDRRARGGDRNRMAFCAIGLKCKAQSAGSGVCVKSGNITIVSYVFSIIFICSDKISL